MTTDFFGESYVTESEIVKTITEMVKLLPHIWFKSDLSKTYSVEYDKNYKIPKKGLYFVYKDNVLLYIGYSLTSIKHRLSRYCSVVKRENSMYESHPGAYKHRYTFEYVLEEESLTNMTVKCIAIEDLPVSDRYTIQDYEKSMIIKLRPVFNNETLKSGYADVKEEPCYA